MTGRIVNNWRVSWISRLGVALVSLSIFACDGGSSEPAAPEVPPPSASTPKPTKAPAPTATPTKAPPPVAEATPTATAKAPPAPDLPEVSPENQAKSKALNSQGYALYKEKRYPEAIDAFEEAAKLDPTYALPPYNLACTLCLVRGGELTCEEDAYVDRIIELVETSVALDPARLERVKEDSDLTCIHRTLAYQALIGYPVSKVENIPRLLKAVNWYGPAPGAFGNMSQLTFKEGGKVAFWELDVRDEIKRLHYTGTYVVDGDRVIVRLDKPTMGGVQGFTGVVSKDGIVTDSKLGPFSDIPSECSA